MERPLAPASRPHSRNLSSFHFPASLRRKNIGNACLACKGRKSKCDRAIPCKNCEKHGTKCVFDPTRDFRRENAVTRKFDEMKRDHHLLDELLKTLRDGDHGRLFRVLAVIRSRASLEEISAYIDGKSTANTSINESAMDETRRVLERVGSSNSPEASVPPPPPPPLRHDPLPVDASTEPKKHLAGGEFISGMAFHTHRPSELVRHDLGLASLTNRAKMMRSSRFPSTQRPGSGSGDGGKRKYRSTACLSCKSRKSKCSGNEPCESCTKHNTRCVFDEESDKRRRLIVKRQMRSLNGDHAALMRLIHILQLSDENQLVHFLRRFRSTSSVDDIKEYINGQPNGELLSALGPIDSNNLTLRRMQLQLTRRTTVSRYLELLHREPIYNVHSMHWWTSMTDNATASHLLSLYFSWDHQVWRFLDPELFLQDLNAGRSRFCSRLLVHTVLFYACGFSYDMERPWDRRVENQLSSRLFEQIVQLWPLEKSSPSLTMAQSSIILGVTMGRFCQDKLGANFIYFGYQTALDLGVHTNNSECFVPDRIHDPKQLRMAHKTIAWGLYDFYVTFTHAYRNPPLWSTPPLVPFSQDEAVEADQNQIWTPYPFRSPVYQSVANSALYARSRLAQITVQATAFNTININKRLTPAIWETGKGLVDKLLVWESNLPECVHVKRDHSPSTLCMHMFYYTTIIILCEMFGSSSPPVEPGLASFQPQRLIHSSTESLGSLVLLYRGSHGWKSIPPIVMHYFIITGVHAVHRLDSNSGDRSRETSCLWADILTACVSGLWHMGLAWPICRFFLRTIQLIVKSMPGVIVPPEVRAIFSEMDSKIWTSTTAKLLSSTYVVHQVPDKLIPGNNRGPSPSRMGNTDNLEDLIASLDNLEVF